MVEEWRIIPDTNDAFAISNLGQVKRLRNLGVHRAGIVKQSSRYGGPYLTVWVRGKNIYVHTLVAEAFIGKIPAGLEINHIDGNPSNNRADNLEYVTHSDNAKHSMHKLLRGNRKITQEIAAQIRAEYVSNKHGELARLSRKFGITYQQIDNIVRQKQWRTQ